MAAIIGPQKGGLVVARADQLLQLQMVRGTMYGSQNWSRTIRGCHTWSPRTVGGWDQFARDRPPATAARQLPPNPSTGGRSTSPCTTKHLRAGQKQSRDVDTASVNFTQQHPAQTPR